MLENLAAQGLPPPPEPLRPEVSHCQSRFRCESLPLIVWPRLIAVLHRSWQLQLASRMCFWGPELTQAPRLQLQMQQQMQQQMHQLGAASGFNKGPGGSTPYQTALELMGLAPNPQHLQVTC